MKLALGDDTPKPGCCTVPMTLAYEAPAQGNSKYVCPDCSRSTVRIYVDGRAGVIGRGRCFECHDRHQEQSNRCGYCGLTVVKPVEFTMHRDGFDLGPQIPMCGCCARSEDQGGISLLEWWQACSHATIYDGDLLYEAVLATGHYGSPATPQEVDLMEALRAAEEAFR